MRKQLYRYARSIRARATTMLRALRRSWQVHRDRMAEESGYAEAFTAVLLAAVELVTDSLRARHLVHALTELYVAVLRALRPHLGEDYA